MKILYKPKKEQWDMFSLRLRTTTYEKLRDIRQQASENGMDLNGMLDDAVNEVVKLVVGATARTNSYTNGSTKVEE